MISLLTALLPSVFGVIDKAIPDKDEATRIKAEIQAQILSNEGEALKAARDTIVAEAEGHSWMQRNWRPLIMLMFGFIIANNFILFPYLSLFTDNAVMLDTPEPLWDLIKIGLGGYVISRSAEKMVKEYKK